MLSSIRAHENAKGSHDRKAERFNRIATVKGINTGEIPPEIEKQLLSVETLEIKDLVVDHRYQRDESSYHVRQMAEHWSWLGCGTLAVSLRPTAQGNQYAVIDGQQRLGALKLLGYTEAPCRIYMDLTHVQEAELYELLNKSKKPGFNDLFKSRLSRGEEKANYIRVGIEQVDYYLDPERHRTHNHFYIQSMVELERIYDLGGVILIMGTLRFIKATYAPEPLGAQQKVLAGVSTFLRDYPEADLKELSEKLRRQGILKTLQNSIQWTAVHGRSGTSGGMYGRAFCEAMLACYNERRQEANRVRSKYV